MIEATSVPDATSRRSDRDRFLSEFALALVRTVDLPSFLRWAVGRLGELLEVDRVSLYLFDGPPEEGRVLLHSSWAADDVAPLPFTELHLAPLAPTLLARDSHAAADALNDPELQGQRELLGRMGTKSLLAAPITADGLVRGFVAAVTVRASRAWGEDEVTFLESAVRHLSASLRQAELLAELGRERDRLSVLLDLAAAIQGSTTSAAVVEAALTGLKETLLFPIAGFAVLAADRSALVGVGGYPEGVGIDFFGQQPLVPGGLPRGRIVHEVLASGAAVVVEDIESDPRAEASREVLRQAGARWVSIFPMRVRGRTVGVLLVAGGAAGAAPEGDDLQTLQSLADLVGAAFEQRRTTEAVQAAMREAQSLSQASRALLTRTADRSILLHQILDALVLHFGKENCSLLLFDARRRSLVPFARRGLLADREVTWALPLQGPGLVAAAAREKRLLNVADVTQDERYLAGWNECRSELVVPLLLDGEVVGAFDLQSNRPAAFTDEDARLLAAFAERAALAIRMADLVGELEERTRVLEALARATRLLNFRLHAPDVLASVVEETSRAFPGAEGSVAWVADSEGQSLTAAAVFGVGHLAQGAFGSRAVPMAHLKAAGVAFRENRPVFLNVSGADDLLSHLPPEDRARGLAAAGNPAIGQLLSVPIRVGDHRLGVLQILAARHDTFSSGDAGTLLLLAEQAAIALRNARLIEELQHSNRLKDDFLANLTHEVRTPLTGIVGWAEVLLDARGEDPQVRRALEAILAQAEMLTRMLSDLIDLSRIDTYGLEIRRMPVRLAETVGEAIDALSPGAARRGVAIRCDVDPDLPPLEGDPSRIKQVLWNLLSNSVKFSPPNATVRLKVRRAPTGEAEILVEDDGCGIDPAFLPYVFDRFRQEESSTSRRFGGLGIGLSIARAVVVAHGGTISVESEGRGKGSRFRVRLPAGSGRPEMGGVDRAAAVPGATS